MSVLLKILNKLVTYIAYLIGLILIFLCCYSIYDSQMLYIEANGSKYEQYKPSPEDPLSFEELQKINPDVFAWLTIDGTKIDYPVAQGPDNQKYVDTNAEGQYSLSGCLFLDSRNNQDFSDFNNIIYGHHMENNEMFGGLSLFQDKAYFDEHKSGNLYFNKENHPFEIIAYIETNAHNTNIYTIKNKEQYTDYVEAIEESATIKEYKEINSDDNLIILSTCHSTNIDGRTIVVGRFR